MSLDCDGGTNLVRIYLLGSESDAMLSLFIQEPLKLVALLPLLCSGCNMVLAPAQ